MNMSKNDGCLFNPIGVECSYADGLHCCPKFSWEEQWG